MPGVTTSRSGHARLAPLAGHTHLAPNPKAEILPISLDSKKKIAELQWLLDAEKEKVVAEKAAADKAELQRQLATKVKAAEAKKAKLQQLVERASSRSEIRYMSCCASGFKATSS